MTDPRYPIGHFTMPDRLTDADRQQAIDAIAAAPAGLRLAVEGLDAEQLDTPYRPEGWTPRQIVHHVPDSHLNAYIRFKLALTEEEPMIKPYDQTLWAELPDARHTPLETSLTLLEALHVRWVALLRALAPEDFERGFKHPEMGRLRLDQIVALYAWHGRHHTAHITSLRDRMGWGGAVSSSAASSGAVPSPGRAHA